MTVTLRPIQRGEVESVAHLTLNEDQAQFSLPPAVALLQDGPFDHFAISAGDEVVGYFRIDRGYAEHMDFALPGEIGLRAFSIGAAYQGQGYAKAACKRLTGLLAPRYPDAPSVVLTVNCRNPAAYRVYLAGGFADTGALYHGGQAGPQHILRMALKDST